jgi:Fanconi anemia group J protein
MDRKKGGGCRFQANVKSKLASHHALHHHMGHNQAWDLEDLVKVGRKLKACPYYASRELKNAAQLIICPYNYLVDPRIRKSMEINVKNQVIVLDEAHNIEDSARDAVSGTFNIDDIAIAMKGLLRQGIFSAIQSFGSALTLCGSGIRI